MSKTKEIGFWKGLLFWVIGVFMFLLLVFIPAEIITRLIDKPDPYYYKKAEKDAHLGWRTKANYKTEHKVSVLNGDSYEVVYETGKYGFRPYGNVQSSLKKLFVLGDSYTQAVEVNSGMSYADHLAHELDAELFCYGQAGYGNLQECLLLEEHLDDINPDLLLLQICGNDLYDNYADLEMHSAYTVGQTRPYIDIDGNIKRYSPVPKWQRINDRSKFLKLIRMKLQTTFPSEKQDYGPNIWKQKENFPPYKRSVDLTELIIQKIKTRAENAQIPMIVLVAGRMEPYRSSLIEICKRNEIPVIFKPMDLLKKKELAGDPVTSSDGYHWTEAGHKFVAQQLVDTVAHYLRTKDLAQ